jgi:hypothetical protein
MLSVAMVDHSQPHYDIAQLCRRGHLVNSGIQETPEQNKEFSATCGEKTIIGCERCGAPRRIDRRRNGY